MERLFEGLGHFAVRFKYPVAIAWIAFTVFAVVVFPSLASVSKDQNSGFLPSDTPSIQAENLANIFQSSTLASMTLVAARSNAPLTTADQAAIDALSRRLRTMPHVKLVRDEGLSGDGQARQVLLQADVSQNGTGAGKTLVGDIRDLFTTSAVPSGLILHLTGALPVAVDTQAANGKSQGQTQGLSLLFILVLLLIAFRALLAPIVTLLPAALVLLLSSPVIAASTRLGVQASSITQLILIVLVLGAGTDYGLFLVFRVREELRHGLEPHDAVIRSLTNVGETISFSALTVIAAMLCLLAAKFGLYSGLGPALAIGIGLMLLAGLTFLPAILAIFGRAVFWPSKVRQTRTESTGGLWGRIGGRVLTHPLVTLLIGVAFFVALALGQLGSGTTGFGDVTTGPTGTDSSAGQTVLSAHYPGSSTAPTAILLQFPQPIWSHPGTLNSVQQYLKASPWFKGVIGPTNPNGIPLGTARLVQLRAALGPANALSRVPTNAAGVTPLEYNAYRATAQFISGDGRTVQWVTLLTYNKGSSSHDISKVPAMRAAIAQFAPTVGASASGVFGLMPFAYDVSHLATDDLTRILPIVALVILVLLAIVLRSLTAPFYLVASVLLSYLAALGLTAIIFVHLGPDSGVNFILPFLMFVFLTGLGSDYNILVMTRIREEAKKLPLRQAVSHAVAVSGGTITTAGVILAGTFAVLAVASGSGSGADQIRQIGYGIAAGVIMDTFLIRTILIPSLVILLGRWNWWPSALYHQGEV